MHGFRKPRRWQRATQLNFYQQTRISELCHQGQPLYISEYFYPGSACIDRDAGWFVWRWPWKIPNRHTSVLSPRMLGSRQAMVTSLPPVPTLLWQDSCSQWRPGVQTASGDSCLMVGLPVFVCVRAGTCTHMHTCMFSILFRISLVITLCCYHLFLWCLLLA